MPDVRDVTTDEASLRRFLHGLPGVDQVGAEARAAALATRSIKTTAKAWAIDTAISMVDLTTLEGADTPGKVRSLCAKAVHPDPGDPSVPAVAAVCVYPDLVETAVAALRGSSVGVASVATAFPSGRAALATKLADVRDAVAAGASEIDMVIDRGAFLAGRYLQVFEEIVATAPTVTEAGGFEAATSLLDSPHPPDAIYSALDRIAIGVLLAADAHDVDVPSSLRVAACTDSVAAQAARPPLTTLGLNPERIGREAVNMLIDLVEGVEVDPRHRIVATRLIERESTLGRRGDGGRAS